MTKKIIAQKFGGTSVATVESRKMMVMHVQRELDQGYRLALVVSAMGRRGDPYATDTLLDLMRLMGGVIDLHNYSFLFVTGEMISVGVVAHTLKLAGVDTVPLTGGQAGIITEDIFMGAGVVSLDPTRLKGYVEKGIIPVVCGGQGMTKSNGYFSVLGRDGSDTSGVLMGVMLDAERVDIYTDVEYMLATDPRLIPSAPKRQVVSFATAYEIARFGAKVVHPGSVSLGMQHNLPIRVRSTFSQNPGTLICDTQDIWPLTGLSLMSPVQIAELNMHGISESQWLAMEQHVGLLRLVDSASGNTIVCTPTTGDTVTAVDKELQENGISSVSWRPGYSLVSLIGSAAALPEMDQRVGRLLGRKPGIVCYHESTSHRVTFVIPESEGKPVLVAVYEELTGYLEPARQPADYLINPNSEDGSSPTKGGGSMRVD